MCDTTGKWTVIVAFYDDSDTTVIHASGEDAVAAELDAARQVREERDTGFTFSPQAIERLYATGLEELADDGAGRVVTMFAGHHEEIQYR